MTSSSNTIKKNSSICSQLQPELKNDQFQKYSSENELNDTFTQLNVDVSRLGPLGLKASTAM